MLKMTTWNVILSCAKRSDGSRADTTRSVDRLRLPQDDRHRADPPAGFIVALCKRPVSLECDQSLARGEMHRFGAAAGAELGQDRGDVKLDGMVADRQSDGDGLVGQAFGNQLQDLALARGKLLAVALRHRRGWPALRFEPPEVPGLDHCEAGRHRSDRRT